MCGCGFEIVDCVGDCEGGVGYMVDAGFGGVGFEMRGELVCAKSLAGGGVACDNYKLRGC